MNIPRRIFLATWVAIAGGVWAARAWRVSEVGTFGNIRTVMAFRPAWLPDGAVEDFRLSTVGAERFFQGRQWRGDKHSVSLEISPAKGPGADDNLLTVQGIPMWIDREFDDICSVWRSLGQGLEANVGVVMANPRAAATRVAASLVADGRTPCEVAMRFGWLPDTTPRDRFGIEMRHRRGEPLTQALSCYDSALGPARAWARVGPTEKAVLEDVSQTQVTDPVTVRGRLGMCAFKEPFGRVLVELSPGKWLCADVDGFRPPLGWAEMLRVVEEMWIGDVPAWLP